MAGHLVVHITGSAHHEGAREAISRLRFGTELALRREPTNRHDRNAIAVLHGGRMLGYVPRTHAEKLARMMDWGNRFAFKATKDPRGWGAVMIEWTDGDPCA